MDADMGVGKIAEHAVAPEDGFIISRKAAKILK